MPARGGQVSRWAVLLVAAAVLRLPAARPADAPGEDIAWIVNYAKLHAGIMEGTVPEERQNFVVWTCRPMGKCGGLGNRIVNIVAAFALAVLTDRAFLIDYPGSSPLELERYMHSDLIDWRLPPWFEHSVMSHGSVHVSLEPNGPVGIEDMIEKRRAFNREVDWSKYSEQVLWVSPETSDLFLTDILRNAHLARRICALGWTAVDEAYSLLSRILLTPRAGVAQELGTFAAQNQDAYVIILQMRAGIGSDFTLFSESEYEQMTADFFSAALAIERAHAPASMRVLWVLLTDQRKIRDLCFARMRRVNDTDTSRQRSIYWAPGHAVHMDKAVDLKEFQRTYVEWLLVSRADAAVLTLESSFALSSWMMGYRGRFRPTHAVVAPRRAAEHGLQGCRSHLETYQCGPSDVCLANPKGYTMAYQDRPNVVTEDLLWQRNCSAAQHSLPGEGGEGGRGGGYE